jgi:hypothetical protein
MSTIETRVLFSQNIQISSLSTDLNYIFKPVLIRNLSESITQWSKKKTISVIAQSFGTGLINLHTEVQ